MDQYIGSPDGIDFRVYSIKRRGAYWEFSVSDVAGVAFIQGRRLFQSHIILYNHWHKFVNIIWTKRIDNV